MCQSSAAAAAATEGYVVGVDVDQSNLSDTVVTSAMKDLIQSVNITLDKYYGGNWSDIGGASTTLGAKDDSVGLPTGTWSLEGFSVEEYETLLAGIKDGSVAVDAAYDDPNGGLEQDWSNLTLNFN